MEDLNSFLRDNQSEASLGHAMQTSSSPLKRKGKFLAPGAAGDTVVVPGAQMLGRHSINGEPGDRELELLFTENLAASRPNETTAKKSKHTFAYQKHNSIVGTGRSSLVSGDSARFGELSVNYMASEVLNPRLNQRNQHHRNVTQSVLGHHEKPRGKAQRPAAQSIRLSSVKYGSQPRAERIQAGRNSLVLTGASQLLPKI
jgi:hypothetical protein